MRRLRNLSFDDDMGAPSCLNLLGVTIYHLSGAHDVRGNHLRMENNIARMNRLRE